jgi:hypothetical protein
MSPNNAGSAPALDIGRCFNEAIAVYKKNVLALLLAAIINEFLSVLTLLVLAGPLLGGICLMTLKGLRREDKGIELGDLFGTFGRFGTLVGLFFMSFLLSLLGLCLFFLPGLLLMTIWLFPFYFVVDRNLGAFEALKASKDVVMRHGLWRNFLVVLISFAFGIGPLLVPYVGPLIGWLLAPLGWLVVTSAYLQQVEEGPDLIRLREAIKPASDLGLGRLPPVLGGSVPEKSGVQDIRAEPGTNSR